VIDASVCTESIAALSLFEVLINFFVAQTIGYKRGESYKEQPNQKYKERGSISLEPRPRID